jgi:PAS domain S-box-containing protein
MNYAVKKFGVIAAFASLALLLIANAYLTRRQLVIQTGWQAWLSHTRQVRFEIQQIGTLLDDAETGQRGFLYTGDPKYLEPYTLATARLDSQLQDLAKLSADNPAQVANVTTLRKLCQAKLAELAETLALYRAGRVDDSRALVLTGHGRAIMQDIRKVIAQMQQEEARLEDARSAAYERSVQRTFTAIDLATAVAILGLGIVAHFILRERRLRERHASQLRAREEWFRVTLNSIGDGVIATDGEGKVNFLNPIAASLTGIALENAINRTIHEVFPIFNEYTGAVAENPVDRVMASGIIVGLANHTVLKHSDGHLTAIEDSAAPIRDDRGQIIGVVLVFRDASRERKSQELMRKAEKLATAARLSATVAHEINNPLEAVINLVFLAKTMTKDQPEIVEKLDLAEQELDRVAHIARQTLGFYRETSLPARIEVAPLIDSVLSIYSNKLKVKEVRAETIADGCPPIVTVSGELKQIVANLVSNAIDAVNPGGRIIIASRCIDLSTGPALELSVEDNGPGVSAEHAERIFEPFFTTKKDVGTGLGLWVAREIAERLGGTLKLRPAATTNGHRGAAFILQLPCSPEGKPAPASQYEAKSC